MEPPTETGSTVIVASAEFAEEQAPLVTTARYFLVATRFVAVSVVVTFATSVEVAQLSVEYCHFVTEPVCPDRVRVVLFVPEHTVVLPATVPPTESGLTVTVASADVAEEQTPLVTTARYFVVATRLVAVREVVTLAISFTVAQLSSEDCHFVTEPTWPESVRVVLLVPVQTVVPPETEPPTEAGSTVIVASAELAVEHTPLFITARYFVVAVKLVAVSVVVVLAMSTGVTQLSTDDCHFVIVPVCPDRVRVVLLVPVHTVVLPATEPPTDTGSTVTVASAELAEEHTPLVITARYFVVEVKLVAVRVVVVFAMSTGVTQLSTDDCHFVIEPVWPDNVRVVLLVPEQTVVLPAIVPPTEAGSTVIVASEELAVEHTPLFITARYFVVSVRLVAVRVVVVFATSVELPQLFVEYCHFVIVPVCPESVRVVLLVPVHTVVLPATEPPTETGSTVTVASAE
jgi:hypothetical protein